MRPANQLPEIFLKSVELPKKEGGRSNVPVYILGCFESRVTLYSQQVRALNLIYSLFDLNKLSKNSNLAIMGGGAAGITAAAGASFLGCRVTLIERKKILHLFENNRERFIHPHIYDWPLSDSENPDAGLPLLNWRASLAADVSDQLKKAWAQIPKENIAIFEGAEDIGLGNIASGERPEIFWKAPDLHKESFDAVIVAVGFGSETQIPGLPTLPYWDNDEIGKISKTGRVTKYLVSGCGDGGFVDLLRIRLKNFRHERVIEDFLSKVNSKAGAKLKEELLRIEDNGKANEKGWLNEQYKALDVPSELDNVIITSLRSDTVAILNGSQEFPITSRPCILNRLLVSRLLRYGTEYLSGKVDHGETQPGRPGYTVVFSDGMRHSFDRVIVRHGPTPATNEFPEIADGARHLRELNYLDNTRMPIWPDGTFGLKSSSGLVGSRSFTYASKHFSRQITFRNLSTSNQAAAKLLKVWAFLGTAALPEDFFFKYLPDEAGDPTMAFAADAKTLAQAIADGVQASLIQHDPVGKSLTIDGDLQIIIKGEIGTAHTERREWAERAVRVVARAFPSPDDEHWEICNVYIPHVEVVVQAIEEYHFDFDAAVRLLSDTAHYHYRMANYERADQLARLILSIRLKRYGQIHSAVADTIHSLGLYAHRTGQFEVAEGLYLQALDIREKILDKDRAAGAGEVILKADEANIAASYNNLAWLYYFLGRYSKAKERYVESLNIRRKVLDADDPKVAMSLNNFARLSYTIGEYAPAEQMYKESLSIRENRLSPEHPELAQSYNNLGLLYFKQGKYEAADALYRKSLEIYNKANLLGHPDVAQTLNNLALLYLKQGKDAQAEAACWRSRWIWERVQGTKHPEVAHTLKILGEWYLRQKDYAQAEACTNQALLIRKESMGAYHPYVAQALNTLADIYNERGDLSKAESLAKRGLAIRCKTFSVNYNHPDIAESFNTLVLIYFRQGKYDRARQLMERVLTILEAAFDAQHPDIEGHIRAYIPMLRQMNYTDVAEAFEARIK